MTDEAFDFLLQAIKEMHRAHELTGRSAMEDALLAWSTVHGFATLAVEGALEWIEEDRERLANSIAERLTPLFAT